MNSSQQPATLTKTQTRFTCAADTYTSSLTGATYSLEDSVGAYWYYYGAADVCGSATAGPLGASQFSAGTYVMVYW